MNLLPTNNYWTARETERCVMERWWFSSHCHWIDPDRPDYKHHAKRCYPFKWHRDVHCAHHSLSSSSSSSSFRFATHLKYIQWTCCIILYALDFVWCICSIWLKVFKLFTNTISQPCKQIDGVWTHELNSEEWNEKQKIENKTKKRRAHRPITLHSINFW